MSLCRIETEPTPGGGVTETGSLATPISSASKLSITNPGSNVNKNSPTISKDGVTRQVSTGNAVEPMRITAVDGTGGFTVAVNGGQEISGEDISFDSTETDMLWRTVSGLRDISASDANMIINGVSLSNAPGDVYLSTAHALYTSGYYNIPVDKRYSGKIRPELETMIYKAGQRAAGAAVAKQQANVQAAADAKVRKTGGVYYGYDGNTMKERQKSGKKLSKMQAVAVDFAQRLAGSRGITFYFYESDLDENGNRVCKDRNGKIVNAENGFYDSKDGTIHIDLNAGSYGRGSVLFTIAHELTHFIQDWSPKHYKKLCNILMKGYAAKGQSVEELVTNQQAYAKEHGRELTREEAYDEVIADSMESILADGKVMELMRDIEATDKSLADKVKKFFQNIGNLLKKTIQAYSHVKPDSEEGRMVQGMQDIYDQLQQVFAEGLYEGGDNYRKAEKNTTDEGGVKFSIKTHDVLSNKTITASMSDSERAHILRSKHLIAPIYKGQADALIKEEEYNLRSGQDKLVKAALVRIGEEFNVFIDYDIKDIDVKITLSRGNLRESVSKKASSSQIAKLIPVLKNAVENAIGVESHKNRYFYDNTTISFDNLIGGYVEGEYFVPVRFGLKHIRGGEVTLYVVIDQQKIKAEVLKPITQNDGSTGSRSAYDINIAQIIPFVNSKDLLRYLPDDMLSREQKEIKWEGIAETIVYTNNKNDQKYKKFIDAGNMQAAKMMVDAAAKAAGYTIKAYHGTTNRQEKSRWNPYTRSWDTEYQRITVFKRQYPEQAGHFFNSDMDNAGGYGSDLYSVYLMLKKPLVIDCKGQNYASITYDGKEMDTYEWATYAKNQRYDGVIFENISDGVGYDDLSKLTTDYVVFDSNRIKSAETI